MDSSAPLTRAAPLGHVPPLDGMRGVLILLVLTVHANYFAFESFAVMVDGFFIASGFLITTLLLEEHRRSGRLNGKSFYFRRAFRLLPTLYVVVGVTLIIGVLFATPEMRTKTIEDVIAASTYTYHVVFPVGEEIARSSGPDVRPLIQVWSLSVEEHFYLLTFPLMLIVIRFRAIRTVAGVLLGMWAAIGMARALGYVGPRFAWYQRPDALMIGVASGLLNAIMPTELSEKANRFLRQAANASVVALGVVIGIGTTIVPARLYFPVNPLNGAQLRDGLYWGRFGFSIGQICFTTLIIAIVRQPKSWQARWLSTRWLGAVGVRSYCLYLVHVPIAVLAEDILHPVIGAWWIVPVVVLLPITTELLHRYVEQPGIRARRRLLPNIP